MNDSGEGVFERRINESDNSSDRSASETLSLTISLYTYIVPLLVALCLLSVVVNAKILGSVFWIRRPMSPTMQISLSLAGADAYSALCLGVGLVINSWLPVVYSDLDMSNCPTLVFEGLRLGGIIMTVLHLAALAVNHYLGIVRPLHYAALVTRRATCAALAALWALPAAFFFTYFTLIPGDGFQKPDCGFSFLLKWHFRMVFSSMFFGAFILMAFIYTHIFKIVRQHQVMRLRYSRTGSTRVQGQGFKKSSSEQQLASNVKATWTTLLILGSYLIGWIPGTIQYLLVCEDCLYPLNYFSPPTTFFICVGTNTLIILKTVLNPIIYAARMSEIKRSQVLMNLRISQFCGRHVDPNDGINNRSQSENTSISNTRSNLPLSRVGRGSQRT